MKILGIGVDIVNNKRIQSLINNQNFIRRTFGPNELKFSKNNVSRANFFAKRFAAKEALSKSFGTGIRDNLSFKDIEIFYKKFFIDKEENDLKNYDSSNQISK